MKHTWEDLPKPLGCFTVRNAAMVNLDTGKIVSNYSANTKIVVAQKCVTSKGTYYRTGEASANGRNHAFRASAFGLPDEKAPLEHATPVNKPRTPARKKQTKKPKGVGLDSGDRATLKTRICKILRRLKWPNKKSQD